MPRKRPYNPGEPAREDAYRRLSNRIRTQNDALTFLLKLIRTTQARLTALEKKFDAHTHPGMVRQGNGPDRVPDIPPTDSKDCRHQSA